MLAELSRTTAMYAGLMEETGSPRVKARRRRKRS
jgi:hypothetical protein